MPGVGFASLQTGSDANRTALAVFYGIYWGHAHWDRLQLDLYSLGHALLPDLGYPETADAYDPRRAGFISHTVAHNTVMVNARRQAMARGRLHLYDPGSGVQVVETSAEDCYPGTVTLYRRTLMLVDVSPDRAYVVDIFRVRGGEQHDLLAHGPQAEFETDLALSAPRQDGTLAGPEVPYGAFYDDERFGAGKPPVPYHEYEGSAFQWLFNVRQAGLGPPSCATWHLNRPASQYPWRDGKGVALRAHLVGHGETVFACDGVPQRRDTWPETLTFLVRRRQGDDLESVFVTVHEPYRDRPFIESVRPLPVASAPGLPVALEIATAAGRHIVFSRLESPSEAAAVLHLADGTSIDARAAVLGCGGAGPPEWSYVLDGDGSAPAACTTVESMDYERGVVHLDRPVLGRGAPAGGIAVVESPHHSDAICVARILDDRTFSVGDEDLTAGTVHVTQVEGSRIEFTPKHVWFIRPGMTAVNEAGTVVGRVESVEQGRARLSSRSLKLEDFPDGNGDSRRTCRFAVVGPGDRLTLHWSARAHTTTW